MTAEIRDQGSTTTSYKPTETSDDFIQKYGREFRDEMQQRADFAAKAPPHTDDPKPAKRSRYDTKTEIEIQNDSEEISKI